MKLTLALLTLIFSASLAQAAPGRTNAEGEFIPAAEAAQTEEITAMIRAMVLAGAEKDGHAHRDAHRKHHGCVKAEFQVLDVPEDLRHGLFAEQKSFPSWIRLSNGSGASQDDREGDGRGFAIKLMGVKGVKALDEAEEETQDFLMINHPVFFVRNAEEYVSFQKSVMNGRVWAFFLNPFRVFHEFQIANDIRGKKVNNPLSVRYWSMVPSKLGNSAMKFSVAPCAGGKFVKVPESHDQLRESLEAQLSQGDACFDFMVQPRTNPKRMPIEDATIEWSEKQSPFVKVARIVIPAQKPEQGEFCEALSFTPWHSLAAHRPLGGISRVRKLVYEEISRTRHDFNRQERREPRQ